VYSLPEFEFGVTHEDLWNAAQLQLVQDGKVNLCCNPAFAQVCCSVAWIPSDVLGEEDPRMVFGPALGPFLWLPLFVHRTPCCGSNLMPFFLFSPIFE
jgi:hypothetical protein